MMIKRFLGLFCALPLLAHGAADSKYVSERINAPMKGEFSVSTALAETEAKKYFCGIQGEACDPVGLTSTCAALESRKKQLRGFKCMVFSNEPARDAAVDSLSVIFGANLAFHSSSRVERPFAFDPAKQSKAPVKIKGAVR